MHLISDAMMIEILYITFLCLLYVFFFFEREEKLYTNCTGLPRNVDLFNCKLKNVIYIHYLRINCVDLAVLMC
jgi:hypothetical protein